MADRVEREIEEILRKIDNFVPERSRRQTGRPGKLSSAQGWLSRKLSRVSLNQVMGWALILTLVSYFLLRGSPLGTWLMIGGLIVFVTALIFSRVAGTGAGPTQTQKRWRGEPIDLSGPSLPDRIKAWVKGRKHH